MGRATTGEEEEEEGPAAAVSDWISLRRRRHRRPALSLGAAAQQPPPLLRVCNPKPCYRDSLSRHLRSLVLHTKEKKRIEKIQTEKK
jgi:hypothetical protein